MEEEKCTIPINEIKIRLVNDKENDETYQISTEEEIIIEKAKLKGEEIIQKLILNAEIEAEALKERIFDEAYAKGLAEGKEDGYNKGYEEGANESDLLRNQAKLVLQNAHKSSKEMIEKNELEIIDLAIQIANKIMVMTIQNDDKPLISMAQNVCKEFKNKKHVIISVCPQKKSLFETNIDDFKKICPNTSFTILEDERISEMGCILESDAQVIDTQITLQLEKVKEALIEMGMKNEG